MLPLHTYNSTYFPLAARQRPSTRIEPSCTSVHDWFDSPCHLARSTGVPPVVLPDGSSRHLPLPPCWRIDPVVPLSAAALTVQVNDAAAAALCLSVAVTVML